MNVLTSEEGKKHCQLLFLEFEQSPLWKLVSQTNTQKIVRVSVYSNGCDTFFQKKKNYTKEIVRVSYKAE